MQGLLADQVRYVWPAAFAHLYSGLHALQNNSLPPFRPCQPALQFNMQAVLTPMHPNLHQYRKNFYCKEVLAHFKYLAIRALSN